VSEYEGEYEGGWVNLGLQQRVGLVNHTSFTQKHVTCPQSKA